MRHTRACALALVNWKGVFFERYLLDPGVTALEGANGAGKTTVMVAAYVVLLPDLSRLRFTNVGESGGGGAADRGLRGRLGSPDRPSYAALELETRDGTRLVAGVHLRQKGNDLELSPFVFSGPSLEGRLKSLLLLEHAEEEEVPELSQVKAQAAALGGALTVFQTAKEYFAFLFDQGVLPMRLGTEEERKNWNELLRTSLSGGMSRALTSELRSFLLREESGLSDTLQRMRASLDACRRTRAEVREATLLESEIGGVHEAGEAMFEAAFAAVSCGLERARGQLAVADAALEGELRVSREAREAHAQVGEQHQQAEQALSLARERQAQQLEREGLQRRVEEARREREALPLEVSAQQLGAVEAVATGHREEMERAREGRERARREYEEAASALSDWQQGLEELHRLAHTERRREQLEAELGQLQAPEDLKAARAQLAALDQELLHLQRKSVGASLFNARIERAHQLLLELEPELDRTLTGAQLQERWVERKAQHARDLNLADSVPQRTEELARARKEREPYDRALLLAERMQIAPGGDAAAQVRAELQACKARGTASARALAEHQRQQQKLEAQITSAELDLERQRTQLEDRQARHELLRELCESAAREGIPRSSSALEGFALEARAKLAHEADGLSRQLEACRTEALSLEVDGGTPEELQRLADALGGEVLATRFDDVELEAATRIEAELGPLAHAIVVADLERAVASLAGLPRPPGELALVRADTALGVGQRSERRNDEVWVTESYGLRIVPAESRGAVGRARRRERIEALRSLAQELEAQQKQLAQRRAHAEAWSAALRSADASELLESPPEQALHRLRGELEATKMVLAQLDAEREGLVAQNALEVEHAQLLEELLELSHLLHYDARARAAQAQTRMQEASAAAVRAERSASLVRELSRLDDALGEAPIDPAQVEQELARAEAARDALSRVISLRSQLEGLGPKPSAETRAGWESALREGEGGARLALQEHWQQRQRALHEAEARSAEVEQRWQAATTEQLQHLAQHQVLQRRAEELSSVEAALLSELAALDARQREEALSLDEAEAKLLACMGALAHAEAKVAQAEERVGLARAQHEQRAELAEGHERIAQAFALSCEQHQLVARTAARGEPEAWQAEAQGRSQLLLDRLTHARGSAACLAEVRPALAQGDYVRAWGLVRAWLSERLPLALAALADPHAALGRLRGELRELSTSLERQEQLLRGTSSDVAHGIDVRVQRAKTTVRRMNQHLAAVQFGHVSAIKLELGRLTKMDAVLEALRDGQAQSLLFDPSMPLEQAFEEIFRRFAGGGKGADRILDYREYLELSVWVQRRGKSEWELASPARLSTGEAIGVGASLLMVVLTEWEQAAQMFRQAKGGSLRFLFLDEANRLSSDNLTVLFELCERLQLQLLLAAPEIAQGKGNTTYRLVRRVDAQGREEVAVTGRRYTEPEPVP